MRRTIGQPLVAMLVLLLVLLPVQHKSRQSLAKQSVALACLVRRCVLLMFILQDIRSHRTSNHSPNRSKRPASKLMA